MSKVKTPKSPPKVKPVQVPTKKGSGNNKPKPTTKRT